MQVKRKECRILNDFDSIQRGDTFLHHNTPYLCVNLHESLLIGACLSSGDSQTFTPDCILIKRDFVAVEE